MVLKGVNRVHNDKTWSNSLKRSELCTQYNKNHGFGSKNEGKTLIYWPNWNNNIKKMCLECDLYRENQMMPANVPTFEVNATHPEQIC